MPARHQVIRCRRSQVRMRRVPVHSDGVAIAIMNVTQYDSLRWRYEVIHPNFNDMRHASMRRGDRTIRTWLNPMTKRCDAFQLNPNLICCTVRAATNERLFWSSINPPIILSINRLKKTCLDFHSFIQSLFQNGQCRKCAIFPIDKLIFGAFKMKKKKGV